MSTTTYAIEPATYEERFSTIEADYKAGRKVWREVDEEAMYYALEVLPPIYVAKGFMVGEPYTDDQDGTVYAAYTKVGARWFSIHTTRSRYAAERQGLLEALVAQDAKAQGVQS